MPFVSSNQGAIHYLDRGRGPAVMLLHGLGSRGSDWEPQLQVLTQNFRVIAPDLRGHGASDASAGPYTLDMLAADMVAVLDALAIPHCHLVGFSLGAAVALELAQRRPARLWSLTLINLAPPKAHLPLRLYGKYWQRQLIIRCFGLRRLGPVIARQIFPHAGQRDLRHRFCTQLAEMPTAAYLACLGALFRWRGPLNYEALAMPVLAISSDRDYTPVAEKARLCERLPNATLKIVTESRHAATLDQPEQINRYLLEFFTAQEACSAV